MELTTVESNFNSTLTNFKDLLNKLQLDEKIPQEEKERILSFQNFLNSIKINFNNSDNSYSFCIVSYSVPKKTGELIFTSVNTEQTKFFLSKLREHISNYFKNIITPIEVQIQKNIDEDDTDATSNADIVDENTKKQDKIKEPEIQFETQTYVLDSKNQLALKKLMNSFFKAISQTIAYIHRIL